MLKRLKRWLVRVRAPLKVSQMQMHALIEVNLLELHLSSLDATYAAAEASNAVPVHLKAHAWLDGFKRTPPAARRDWEVVGSEARALNRQLKSAITATAPPDRLRTAEWLAG